MKRWHWALLFISFLSIGVSLVLPLFDKKSGLEVIQSFFQNIDKTADGPFVTGDPPGNESAAYHYWYAPPDSFGVSSMKTVNWSYFKQLFLAHTDWMLEYKRYESSSWTNGSDYLTINRTWNDSGFWKFNLILDVPVHVYSARFTFGVDLPVLQYVERDGYEVWINYTANASENYSVMFNWSDIASILGLVITKGVQDDMFWFRFRRDDIPAGHYEFDPTFGKTDTGFATVDLWSGNTGTEYLRGSHSSPASSGITDNITVYFKGLVSYDDEFECALYEYVDHDSDIAGELLKLTEAKTVYTTDVDSWVVFDFSVGYSVVADTQYYICIRPTFNRGTDSGKKIQMGGTNYVGNGLRKSGSNGVVFDDPLTGDIAQTTDMSLYVSYTIGAANNAPTIAGEIPANQSTSIGLSPVCNVTANDDDGGDTLTVTFYENTTGSYVLRQKNISVSPGASVQWDSYTNANTGSTKYWWKVHVDDATDNVSETYYFTTEVSRSWQNIFTGYATGGNITVAQEIFTGYAVGGNIISANQIFSGYASGGNATVRSWQNIFTGYATGGNATVLWQQIFSGYAAGGNATVLWQQIFSGYAAGGNIISANQIFSGYASGGNITAANQIFSGYATGGNIISANQIFSGYAVGGNVSAAQSIFSGYASGGNITSANRIFSGYAVGGNITMANQIFSGYAVGGNATVLWQQIFSGYAAGGNITMANQIFSGYATGGNTTVNNAPTIIDEIPANNSIDISVIPQLNVTVDDLDDDTLTAYWYSNSTFSNGFSKRKLITINHNLIDETLSNFPILISITDSDLVLHVQTDGDDILFVDSEDNQLNHEIERYNSETGELIAWVNITTLSADTDTNIWLYYGNSTCSSQENIEDTWDSNYIAVYHMNDDTTSTITDSTSNNNDGAKSSANNPTELSGKIGYSQDFSLDTINCGNDNSLDMINLTVESWFLAHSSGGSIYPRIAGIESGTSARPWAVERGGSGISLNIEDAVEVESSHIPFDWGGGSEFNTWIYGVWTFINGTQTAFKNGTSGTSDNVVVDLNNQDYSLRLGNSPSSTRDWDGLLDEIRLSDIVRNASYVNATFHTQNKSSGFITYGDEETPGWSLFATNSSIDTSGGSVDINQINNNFSAYSTKYWWSVNLTDGTDWSNETYHFTTEAQPKSWQQIFTGYAVGGNQSAAQSIFSGWVSGGNATVSWQQIFSGWVSGGNATVSWQQIFSGYATGGNQSAAQSIFSGWVSGGNATVRSWQNILTGYATGGNIPSANQIFSGYATGGNISRTLQQIFSGYAAGGNISNIAPALTGIYPADMGIDEAVPVTFGVTVLDADGDNITIRLFSNRSGTWIQFTLIENVTNGSYYLIGVDFNLYSQDYYWYINLTDTYNNTYQSGVYSFTTISFDDVEAYTILPVADSSGLLLAAAFFVIVVMGFVWYHFSKQKQDGKPPPPQYNF